jgi:hypothetical protein
VSFIGSIRGDETKRTQANGEQDDQPDEAQFAGWVKQASQLPGERM